MKYTFLYIKERALNSLRNLYVVKTKELYVFKYLHFASRKSDPDHGVLYQPSES